MPKEWDNLKLLADDARARGLYDLCVVYQEAAIKIGWQAIAEQIKNVESRIECPR